MFLKTFLFVVHFSYTVLFHRKKAKKKYQKSKNASTSDTLVQEHVNTQDMLAREHVNMQETLEREHVHTQGMLTREHVRMLFTRLIN